MEKTGFKDFIHILLKDKWILIISIVVVLLFGLLLYWITPNEYDSAVVVTPSSATESGSEGAFGNLASIAGLSAQGMNGGVGISLYDDIVSSTPFLRDLINQKVYYKEDSVYLQDYLSQGMVVGIKNQFYHLFSNSSGRVKYSGVADTMKEKDLGHPMFLDRLKVVSLTGEQKKAINLLKEKISYTVDQDKPINVVVSLQDPEVSAQTAVLVVKLLSDYVEGFQYNKGQTDMVYLQHEADSARRAVYGAQDALAVAKDRNRGLVSALPEIEISRLTLKYQMAQGVYNDIMGRINDLQLRLDKQKPAFIIIEPPQALNVNYPSSPRLVIYIILSLVLGVLAGIAIVAIKHFLFVNFKFSGTENLLDKEDK